MPGSASVVRGDGVGFVVEASTLEDGPIKTRCRRQGLSVEETTMAPAEAKAADVVARHPGALVK